MQLMAGAADADSDPDSQTEAPSPDDANRREAARRLNNTRSSQLFEAPVELPLTPQEQRMVLQLDFFKRWYLLCHAAYLLSLVVIGTGVFFFVEPDLPLVDAFFVAMSTVCNCGLQTVDVADWHEFSVFFRHLLMIGGGVVFTSAYQPLLRLVMLHRVRSVFAPNEDDTASERRLRKQKEAVAQRLYHTSIICVATSWAYFAVVNVIVMLLLCFLNSSSLSLLESLYMSVSAFHSCVFLSMQRFVKDPAVVGLVTAACALGFTAFPAVLRAFIVVEWRAYKLLHKLMRTCCRRRALDGSVNPLLGDSREAEEEDDRDDGAGGGTQGQLAEDPWSQGFEDILSSHHPGTFHPFLFLPSETAFLGAAWWALTLMQAIPFWFQHWDSLLGGFSAAYKVFLAICQAGVVRFAAASFVPLAEYSNAHIAVTILAMFLPALPISTDRTYRKWKLMMTTSVVRLLTSRLFWLFTAMVSILFAEERNLAELLRGTRFDIMTRTFFEIISAYSGCGLSLSVPHSTVSFSGSTGTFSNLVICAVLFGGRHRFVDLGIDLGFSALQANLRTTSNPTGSGSAMV